MRKTILLAIVLALAGFITAAAPHAGASTAPVRLTFDEAAFSGGTWQGTGSGDLSASLPTVLTEQRITGPARHVRFDWIVDAAGSSFVADLPGTLNTETGGWS